MSKANIWMPLYVSDYLADTGHLTIEQSGAYLHLLMYSWRTGRLPDDDRELATLCRMSLATFRRSIADKVRPFFIAEGGILKSPRLEAERENAKSRSLKCSANSLKRWGVKHDGTINENKDITDAVAMPADMPNACTSPSPSESKEERKEVSNLSSVSPTARASLPDADFETWWSSYPRKIGKGKARTAYAAARRKAEASALLDALQSQSFSHEERFIPHPATWLNGERWLDQPTIPLAQPVQPARHKTAAELLREMWAQSDATQPGTATVIDAVPLLTRTGATHGR